MTFIKSWNSDFNVKLNDEEVDFTNDTSKDVLLVSVINWQLDLQLSGG